MKIQEPPMVKIVIVFFLIWEAILVYIDRNILADFANATVSKVLGTSIERISPTPTFILSSTPTDEPIPTSLPVMRNPQPNLQQPANSRSDNNFPTYLNYGWYTHNGVSMQYVNGNWYASPQQGELTPTIKPAQNTQATQPNYVYVNCKAADGWTFVGYGTSLEEANQNCANNAQGVQTSQPSVNNLSPQTLVNQPAPQNNNAQLNQQCQANALDAYQAAQQRANAFGGGNSAGEAALQIAQQQYNQAIANCNSEYPY